ncbi:DUF3900 domain-containing protein [Gorillibacterium massiliense]|uniref:DUF3900 domain-containing protein n=1 Tax=Gorillibacterium massiliense TaxID=1280390 RepID=UPI0004AEE873|nr:DUF3900 domain-containing protein [Gorillibacterium massiliense]
MDFTVEYLSFYVIQGDGDGGAGAKGYKHYRTMDRDGYMGSEIREFLDSEFPRIVKRKAERNAGTENAPTKIGRFIVEPGHELSSNPNFNLFQRLRLADSKESFQNGCDDMVRMYMDTSAVRGGAFIAVAAKLTRFFDEPFLFVLKCDFEPKVARISDERSLISQVDMAISARNMKSIQYPHMPEEGMLEEEELKIHQASHARYFEDFLRYVSYEKSMPEMITEQVTSMVQQFIEEKWPDSEHEERKKEEQNVEFWSASEKRELQALWEHRQVVDAAVHLTAHKEDLELKFKLDGVAVKGFLADYGDRIHIAEENGRYVVLIEGDLFQFEKGVSPIELLKPPPLAEVVEHIRNKAVAAKEEANRQWDSNGATAEAGAGDVTEELGDAGFAGSGEDAPPW